MTARFGIDRRRSDGRPGRFWPLASIVEGEAVRDDERGIIAGVYWNRLPEGDETGGGSDDPVSLRMARPPAARVPRPEDRSPVQHIQTDGTSPRASVNNPGRASITAALYPVEHRYSPSLWRTGRGDTGSRRPTQSTRRMSARTGERGLARP
ncbi:MAG: endolytic transglycosylase MltG [Ignavibacteriales bacterium]|nr:endolytic transglycosylase MltG [Ignavibacteriales bacterium]